MPTTMTPNLETAAERVAALTTEICQRRAELVELEAAVRQALAVVVGILNEATLEDARSALGIAQGEAMARGPGGWVAFGEF